MSQYHFTYNDKKILSLDSIEEPIYIKFLFNLVEGKIDILNPNCSVTLIDNNTKKWTNLGQITFNHKHELKEQLKQFSVQYISLLRDFEDKSFFVKHGFEEGGEANSIRYPLNDLLKKYQSVDLKELLEDLTDVLRKTMVKNIINFYEEKSDKTQQYLFSMKKK